MRPRGVNLDQFGQLPFDLKIFKQNSLQYESRSTYIQKIRGVISTIKVQLVRLSGRKFSSSIAKFCILILSKIAQKI